MPSIRRWRERLEWFKPVFGILFIVFVIYYLLTLPKDAPPVSTPASPKCFTRDHNDNLRLCPHELDDDGKTKWPSPSEGPDSREKGRESIAESEDTGTVQYESEEEGGRWEGEKRVSDIPLVVVEEHHEVIPHWYSRADMEQLPRAGNVLLHIDAHSDVTLPVINTSFPLFRYPDQPELVYLMQRNDMFIVSAALTGLFNRYIWVAPPWETRVADVLEPSGYARFHISAGVLEKPEQRHEQDGYQQDDSEQSAEEADSRGTGYDDEPRLCYCVDTTTTLKLAVYASNNCFLHTGRSPQNPLGVSKLISRGGCRTSLNILAEVVTESKAIELMIAQEVPRDNHDVQINRSGSAREKQLPSRETIKTPWLGKEESVIVDIDEDYYGVEAADTPLRRATVPSELIDTISSVVSRLFCPEDAKKEAIAGRVFDKLLDNLYHNLLSCREDQTCFSTQFQQHIEVLGDKFRIDIEHHDGSTFLCGGSLMELEEDLKNLVKELATLTNNQLRAMRTVGICLRESPKTMGFDPSRGMTVCTGRNRSDRSAVIFHVPDRTEMHKRTMNLYTLFHHSRFTPRVITMARSVRDGYTPRSSFRRIENDLLYILHHAYPHVTTTDRYDPNLLGGVKGWYNRH